MGDSNFMVYCGLRVGPRNEITKLFEGKET